MLIKPEHEIHVLYGLPAGTFKEVVDGAGDEQFVVELLNVNKRFVGIDHLLEIDVTVDIMRESGRLVELTIELDDVLLG